MILKEQIVKKYSTIKETEKNNKRKDTKRSQDIIQEE